MGQRNVKYRKNATSTLQTRETIEPPFGLTNRVGKKNYVVPPGKYG